MPDDAAPPTSPNAPRSDRNVVLTGFMGTGKTTVGRLLAQRLGFTLVDTDHVIIERNGPIPEIFAHEGEQGFRRHERALATELAGKSGLVISTGGRFMLDEANAAALEASGEVFCLTASADEVIRRVLADPEGLERPLLAGDDPEGRVRELMAERAPHYARFTQIDTEGRSPQEVADAIAAQLPTQ